MTTDTIMNMSYIAKIDVRDGAEITRSDLNAVAKVLEELLGPVKVGDHMQLDGVIEASGVDLEAIQTVLESGQGVDIHIGIARNKALAEIAILWGDRSGITHISPSDEDTYLAGIPVGEISGVTTSTASRMRKFQIYTAYDLKYSSQEFLVMNFSSEIVELFACYNTYALIEPRTWYKQVSIGRLSQYIGGVLGGGGDSSDSRVPELDSEKLLPRYNEPGVVPTMLNLFNYQYVEKPL